jgi:hypothetical protein
MSPRRAAKVMSVVSNGLLLAKAAVRAAGRDLAADGLRSS